MPTPVGLDLGTTNSAVASVVNGETEVLVNSEGGRTTPSVVHFEDEDSFIVGELARRKMVSNPDTTVARVKRHIGRDWTSQEIYGESYSPEDISSLILQKLVSNAKDVLDDDVEDVVITVPAYFGSREREATQSAGKLAGLNVMRVINEPTAACLAYGLDKEKEDEELALVYDLGGGTFDASLVDIGQGVIEVITTEGDEKLGGEDFDEALYANMRQEYIEQGNDDPEDDLQVKAKLLQEAREAKEALSSQQQYDIDQPFLGPEGFTLSISREMFEEAAEHLVDETIDILDDLFEHASHEVGDVDEILLVGGSTRIPLVQRQVEEYFGKKPSKSINPDEAVAVGAAVQAAIIDAGGEGGGSGEQAKLLPGNAENVVLADILSKSLGIKLHDGSFDPILIKDETIPAYQEKDGYSTVEDNQTSVRVQIFEGEEPVADENEFLGEFVLNDIPPQRAGEPSIQIQFEIDESGLLYAEATDVDHGESADIEIDDVFILTDLEIEERRENLPVYKSEA